MSPLKCSFCLPLILLLSTTSALCAPTPDYEALIQRARGGDYQPALQMLQALEHAGQADTRSRHDHMLIASWAELPDEVLRLYRESGLSLSTLPAPVLSAVARARRDKQEWDGALAAYRTGQARFPGDPAFAFEEAMTLADAGRPEEALMRAQALQRAMPGSAQAHLTLSYIYRSAQRPYDALEQADRARSVAPNKPATVQEYILALQQAGLAQAALHTAQENPDAVSPALMRALRGDYAAELVYLAFHPRRSREERFELADQALANYAQLLKEWEPLGVQARSDVLRARADRILALHARWRMQDAVNEYERLIDEGVTPPDYVLSSVGAAYLHLQHPDKAYEAYEQALQSPQWPLSGSDKTDAQIALFYSMIESENFDLADQFMSDALTGEATWLSIKGVPQRVANDSRLALEQTAAVAGQYAGAPGQSHERLTSMVALAPRDVGQRIALAQAHRARGWPRRAEEELKLTETLSPRAPALIAEQGLTALDLQEWRQARILTDAAQSLSPESVSTQRLAREWEIHEMAELSVTAYVNDSSNSPVSGTGAFGFDTVLYSPPVDDNWRGFAGGGYARGDFEDERATYRWMRAGAQWRGRDLTAQVEASANHYGLGARTGAEVSSTYDLSDQWQIGGSVAFRSRQTPLRALANGTYSNRLNIFAHWQANERREWLIAASPSRFSDGNTRLELQVRGRERLYSAPRLTANLHLDVGASRNTLEDAPYFNPRSDLTVVPSLSLTHILYRHYDTSLEHTFTLGAGIYAQKAYGAGAIGVLGYGLRYRFNKVVDVGVSFTGISRPYDGVRERELNVLATLNLRF